MKKLAITAPPPPRACALPFSLALGNVVISGARMPKLKRRSAPSKRLAASLYVLRTPPARIFPSPCFTHWSARFTFCAALSSHPPHGFPSSTQPLFVHTHFSPVGSVNSNGLFRV